MLILISENLIPNDSIYYWEYVFCFSSVILFTMRLPLSYPTVTFGLNLKGLKMIRPELIKALAGFGAMEL